MSSSVLRKRGLVKPPQSGTIMLTSKLKVTFVIIYLFICGLFNDISIFLLGCDAVWTHRQIPTLWRNILSPPSGVKKEVVSSSKILVSTYESTQHHNPEEHNHLHCHENLKSQTLPVAQTM
jgi:hypothetical protein